MHLVWSLEIILYCLRIVTSIFIFVFFAGCSIDLLPSKSSNDFKTIKNSDAMHRATMKPYKVNGKTYYPTVVSVGDKASGIASWYGPGFHGKKTSNGEIYNMHAMTAAHKTLPMNTMLRVTNLNNSRQVIVRVNDRGPFVDNRIIDLSKAAADKLNIIKVGTSPVLLEVVGFNAKVLPANISTQNSKQIQSKPQTTTDIAENESYIGGDFMVQIGSFSQESGAKSYQAKHKKVDGYQSIIREFNVNGNRVFKVFLVGFRSEDEARDFARSGKFSGAFIVRG